MPAAAVIPAPVAYIKVVAVKKLVVGFLERDAAWPAAFACVRLVRVLFILLVDARVCSSLRLWRRRTRDLLL